jgi:hypothetical protein
MISWRSWPYLDVSESAATPLQNFGSRELRVKGLLLPSFDW